jgi:triose/dihydroxyacetone kinase / FAD-AMP lyase (cyclizing)
MLMIHLADPDVVISSITHALEKLIYAEPLITEYDTLLGDGDCGIGLKRGAQSVQDFVSSAPSATLADPVSLVQGITRAIERSMDGTSGALYAIFFNALVAALASQGSSKKGMTAADWAQGLRSSLSALGKYTPARPGKIAPQRGGTGVGDTVNGCWPLVDTGDRTLIDALVPFIDTLESTGDVKQAAKAAQDGATATIELKASLGRAVYVGDGGRKVPDPGAYGLAEFLVGLGEGL